MISVLAISGISNAIHMSLLSLHPRLATAVGQLPPYLFPLYPHLAITHTFSPPPLGSVFPPTRCGPSTCTVNLERQQTQAHYRERDQQSPTQNTPFILPPALPPYLVHPTLIQPTSSLASLSPPFALSAAALSLV